MEAGMGKGSLIPTTPTKASICKLIINTQRAQVSLEVLVVAAALIAMLAALAPPIGRIASLASEMQKEKQAAFEIERIYSALKETALMGNGAGLEMEAHFPTPVRIWLSESAIVFQFEVGGKQKKIAKEAHFGVLGLPIEIGKGGHLLTIKAEKGALKVAAEAKKS